MFDAKKPTRQLSLAKIRFRKAEKTIEEEGSY